MAGSYPKYNWDVELIEKLAAQGLKHAQIAAEFGVAEKVFRNAIYNRPEVKEAHERGVQKQGGGQ